MSSITIYSRVGQDVDVRLKDGKTETLIRDWGKLKARGQLSLPLATAQRRGPWTVECKKGKKTASLLLKVPGKVEVREKGTDLQLVVPPPLRLRLLVVNQIGQDVDYRLSGGGAKATLAGWLSLPAKGSLSLPVTDTGDPLTLECRRGQKGKIVRLILSQIHEIGRIEVVADGSGLRIDRVPPSNPDVKIAS